MRTPGMVWLMTGCMSDGDSAPSSFNVRHGVMLAETTRDGRVVLVDFAVIVGDPNGTIRPVGEVHGMTPGVGACGEFGFLLAGCASDFQRGTICFDQGAMDKIARRFADEILPA